MPLNDSVLTQMIMKGKSICHVWVKGMQDTVSGSIATNMAHSKLSYIPTKNIIIEPPHGKTKYLYRRKERRRDQLRSNCEADQRLCFRYKDSTISLLSKSKISSLWPSFVNVQAGLCWT